MILNDKIKLAAKKFVVEHYDRFTEKEVALIEIAISIGVDLGLKKSKDVLDGYTPGDYSND